MSRLYTKPVLITSAGENGEVEHFSLSQTSYPKPSPRNRKARQRHDVIVFHTVEELREFGTKMINLADEWG